MNNEDIIQILKSEPEIFTYAEIKQMMDEELDKDPSEMDTDFIDLCANALLKAQSEYEQKQLNHKTENKKRIKIGFAKIIAIAAVVAIILSMAVTVFAKYVKNDASDDIVKYQDDHFSVDLRNSEADTETHSNGKTDVLMALKEHGFDKIVLPTALLGDAYTYDLNVTEDENFITSVIIFEKEESSVLATITKYKNGIDNSLDNETQLMAEYDSATQITKDGMDIFVFGNKDNSCIVYIDNNIEYSISVNTDFDSAIEIAESIK